MLTDVERGYIVLVLWISVVVPADTAVMVKHRASDVWIGWRGCQELGTEWEPVDEKCADLCSKFTLFCSYEGESVNRSQMDIKRITCDIGTWKKKHSFLDISSTNIDTLVPTLYQCVETLNIEVVWLLSQPLAHLRLNFFIGETFATDVEPFYSINTSHRKQ
jgi:hypothetical protein